MNNRELIERAGRITIEAMQGVRPIIIHGIKLIYTDRDIMRNIQYFEFENGWRIPIKLGPTYHARGPDEIGRALVREIELRLKFLDPMELQAFVAPEVLEDEDPDELDPDPVFVCDRCRRYYEVR